MARSKEELKKAAMDAIDEYRQEIIALGESIYGEPELGFKEFKTSAKFQNALDRLGIPYENRIAITGVVAPLKGRESKIRLAVMGELDSVISTEHPSADPVTGAAHCCGHNCQIAGLAGIAYALTKTGIMEELSGDVVLMAVPAEEGIEVGYHKKLKEEGKISYFGGKQEFIKLGVLDDIDMMVMQHSYPSEGETFWEIKGEACTFGNGFISKEVQYIGREAGAADCPEQGINALDAGITAISAINALRQTFPPQDNIRVHAIITKGGGTGERIPTDVRLECFVKAANKEAVFATSEKVSRALKAAGDSVGAETVITDFPGYMPSVEYPELAEVMYQNLVELFGEEHASRAPKVRGGGSSDQADVQAIMPAIQAHIGGVSGLLHTKNYRIADKEMVYISAAKAVVMTVIDLLADGAQTGIWVKKVSRPPYTKEQYLKEWLHDKEE